MTNNTRARGRAQRAIALIAIAAMPVAVAAQDLASPAAAHRLVAALEQAQLDAIATVDPTEAGTFVAALHIKGAQLLVVRARHPSVDAVAARLAAGQFRDVYIDLQATPAPQGKLFVMDTGADGLPEGTGEASNVDVIYEDGTRQTMFNGARAAQLSADAYRRELHAADGKYARLLSLLTEAAAKRATEAQPVSPR